METGQIHGHEVIHIVGSHPEGIPLASVTNTVERQFGQDARFYTCSAENMPLGELLKFLASRDKVELRGNLIFPGGSGACNH